MKDYKHESAVHDKDIVNVTYTTRTRSRSLLALQSHVNKRSVDNIRLNDEVYQAA